MTTAINSDALRKVIEDTTRAFLNSYSDATAANDAALNTRLLTPDCTRILRPESFFKARGRASVLSNADYEDILALDLSIGGMENLAVSDVTVDAGSRRSSATSVWDMVFRDSDRAKMEVAWFLEFTADGTRITRIVEYVDPSVIVRTLEKLNGEGGPAV